MVPDLTLGTLTDRGPARLYLRIWSYYRYPTSFPFPTPVLSTNVHLPHQSRLHDRPSSSGFQSLPAP